MWIRKNKALTLIELLLAAGLSLLIGAALVSVFSAGLKAYNRVTQTDIFKADVLLLFSQMQKDLKNTFVWTGINFTGDKHQLALANLVQTSSKEGSLMNVLGRVVYAFDSNKGVLREQKVYPISSASEGIILLSAVKDVSFSYYFLDPLQNQYGFKSSWDQKAEQGRLPKGVKVEITIQGEHEDIKMQRLILLPSAA